MSEHNEECTEMYNDFGPEIQTHDWFCWMFGPLSCTGYIKLARRI